jgi:hypothetical protein
MFEPMNEYPDNDSKIQERRVPFSSQALIVVELEPEPASDLLGSLEKRWFF